MFLDKMHSSVLFLFQFYWQIGYIRALHISAQRLIVPVENCGNCELLTARVFVIHIYGAP